MGRKLIDCRSAPGGGVCTVAISADTEEELMEAAVQHAAAVHQLPDTPELRDYIRNAMTEATQGGPTNRQGSQAA
jgi:predicted small metal-binding protein